MDVGVTFTNYRVTAPSRACSFTDLYPHSTAIYKNGDQWRHSRVERLADSEYYCVNVGKMHTSPYEAQLSFDERDKALAARRLVKRQRELSRQREDYEERLGAFEWELPEDAHSDVFIGFSAWSRKNVGES